MLDGAGGAALIAKAGNTLVVGPGAMLNLRDLDNLRVLATKKGLILRAGDNGRRTLKLLYKAGATPAKSGAAVAKGTAVQAKVLASSAKSMAVSADTLAKTAKSLAVPAKSIAAGGGLAKMLSSLGTLTALGTLGPVLLLGGMAAASTVAYLLVQREPPPEPEY